MSETDEKHIISIHASSGLTEPLTAKPTGNRPIYSEHMRADPKLVRPMHRPERVRIEWRDPIGYDHNQEMTLYDIHKPLPYTFKPLFSGFFHEPTHSKKMSSPIEYVAKPTVQSIPESTESTEKKKKKKKDTMIDETVKDVLEHIIIIIIITSITPSTGPEGSA